MSIFKQDIGVGIVTCNRPKFLKNLLSSIDPSEVSEIVIFNSGTELIETEFKIISKQNKENVPVGHAKNEILRYFRNQNKKHIFIIEDDMIIKDNQVFEQYIKHAFTSGIYHFNFHKHGPINVNEDGSSKITNSVDYETLGEKYEITFHPHIVGSFSYYYGDIISHAGYMDEKYVNAMEHVDHSYRIHKSGFTTGFGWWADIANSPNYIGEQDSDLSNSVIRKDKTTFIKNFREAVVHFEKKHGFKPTEPKVMNTNDVLDFLEKLHSTNGNMLDKIFEK